MLYSTNEGKFIKSLNYTNVVNIIFLKHEDYNREQKLVSLVGFSMGTACPDS